MQDDYNVCVFVVRAQNYVQGEQVRMMRLLIEMQFHHICDEILKVIVLRGVKNDNKSFSIRFSSRLKWNEFTCCAQQKMARVFFLKERSVCYVAIRGKSWKQTSDSQFQAFPFGNTGCMLGKTTCSFSLQLVSDFFCRNSNTTRSEMLT